MAPLSRLDGWLIVAAYGAMTFLVTWLYSRFDRNSKEFFLAASRRIGVRYAAFSIAATWIWAPALFVSAQKAYQQGVIGLFWFVVPNVLCLVLFAFFANRIRFLAPRGYSMSGFVLETYSRRTNALFLVEGLGLQTCSFAVQLLAGGAVLSKLTGVPYGQLIIALAAIPLGYSLYSGLKASIVTDYWQMIWILLVAFTVIPAVVVRSGGLGTIAAGLSGVSGSFGSFFDANGWLVFWTFGLPTTIGLLSGPFGDQMFWQRAFAIERTGIRAAFLWGAVIFAICPLSMSLLGFALAGAGTRISEPQLANVMAVEAWLPTWVLVPFSWMILSGLISTVDSVICAVSSYVGHDILERRGGGRSDEETVRWSRVSMFVVAIAAIGIALIPGLKIVHLFLFYGTLRASVLLPTVIALLARKPVSEAGLFWGIVVSIFVGLPLMTWGQLRQDPLFISGGSLLTVLSSGVVTVVQTLREGELRLSEIFDFGALRSRPERVVPAATS